MSMSTDGLGKYVRTAVVSGVLGAASLVAMAGVADAQSPSPSPSPSPSSTIGSGGTGTTGGVTTTTKGGTLPITGMDLGTTLAVGGVALAGAIGVRRIGRPAAH